MKKKITAIAIVLIGLTALSASAQDVETGVKGGVNFSNFIQDDIDDQNMRVGWHVGFYSKMEFAKQLFIMPELAFSTKGTNIEYSAFGASGESKLNLYYIDLPVMVGVELTDFLDIYAGPYLSYLIDSNVKTTGDFGEDDTEIDRDNLESFDYGLAGGVGFNFDHVTIGARYNYGLAQIARSDAADFLLEDSRNSVGQIYLTYRLSR
ncbi:PorT family protein [Reichenbachiella agarivorans]|uniref:PorT family protein n=1 Tax=Reichenbachiella agarivorans TaxID=2979464 RepID=A0ABY6CJK8_9BACT|nr:porin family protein [Reichenbachiella agarivorans]UXP30710.1 PorT family protein [Reichenbachiella agarivorans]